MHSDPAPAQADPMPAALLATAVNAVDTCVAILHGPEMRFIFVNRAYQAISPDIPMLGQRFCDVFFDAHYAGTMQHMLDVLRTGTPWRIERYHSAIPSDPNACWEGETVRAEGAGDGEPASLVVIVRNVTATARMEQALARSEENLRRANATLRRTIDSITDGLLVLDRDWRYTLVSDRAAAMVGMAVEDMLGGCVWELFPKSVGTRFYDGYHAAMATGEPVHFCEYYPAPLDIWLECHCYPSANELTVAFRDVTAQRRADDALRKNTALIKAISDTSSDVIFAKDRDGRMLFANPATLTLIGKPLDQVLGNTDADLLGDAEAARAVMDNDRRVMDSGTPEEVEERVPMPDGQERTWLSWKVPYRDDSDRIVGLLGISRDITDRKRDEENLRESNHRKDEFLAMLAHELRNPLAPITTGAQLLELFAHDEQRVRKASKIISRQAAHMVELVDDLLDVSRVTRGLIELQKDDIDIKLVIAAAIEQARPLIEARSHEFVSRMASSHVLVHGDSTRLVQAFVNVLNNAAKYTPAGGQITLAMEVDHDFVTICVDDNGVGMKPELLPKVFDLFSQGERTPDRAQGGLGLGLALVRSIVEMHGGRVQARSAGLGKGSTLVVELPRLPDDAARDDSAAILPATAPRVQPRSIMVVDDNQDAGESLASLLQALGHKVKVCTTSHAALDAARALAPDVFILDIGLPDMDGYQLARALRAQPAGAAATLIALTGYGQPNDIATAKAAGFDEHFVKPVNLDRLTKVLQGPF